MNINLEIWFRDNDNNWYCAKHGIRRIAKGEDLVPDIDDRDAFGMTTCKDC